MKITKQLVKNSLIKAIITTFFAYLLALTLNNELINISITEFIFKTTLCIIISFSYYIIVYLYFKQQKKD